MQNSRSPLGELLSPLLHKVRTVSFIKIPSSTSVTSPSLWSQFCIAPSSSRPRVSMSVREKRKVKSWNTLAASLCRTVQQLRQFRMDNTRERLDWQKKVCADDPHILLRGWICRTRKILDIIRKFSDFTTPVDQCLITEKGSDPMKSWVQYSIQNSHTDNEINLRFNNSCSCVKVRIQ